MNRLFTYFPKACVASKTVWRWLPSQRLHLSQVCNEDQWLWPLSDNGCTLVRDHSVGTRMTMGSWTLEAKKPIEHHHWKQAWLYVRRKSPVMQVKIKKRDGHPWYCQDDNLDTGCEILPPGCDLMKEVIRGSSTWRGMDSDVTSLNGIVVLPEAKGDAGASPPRKASHPHRYTVLIKFHHALYDGVTAVTTTLAFFKLLNHVLDGKSVDDSVKTGVFVSNEEIEKIKKDMIASIEGDILPEENYDWDPVILKGFSAPGGTNPTTDFVFKTINMDDVTNIRGACKREGVAFHTAVMTAYQTAMIEMLQASGVQDDKFTFSVSMLTDLRRFMDKRNLTIHGLHIGRDRMYIEVDVKQKSGFWDLSRKIEGIKKEHISSQEALRQIVAQKCAAKTSPSSDDLSLPLFDYGISNIREVNLSCSNTVQVINGVVYNFVHNTFFLSMIHYYMGKEAYTFTYSYATNLMAENTAVMLMDKTLDILRGKCYS